MLAVAAATQALVDAVIAAVDTKYEHAGKTMRALVEPAPALTFAQIKSVLEAVHLQPVVADGAQERRNQLQGAYDEQTWEARKGQAIIRPFLEQYVVRDGLVAGQSASDGYLFYEALAYSCANAKDHGH
jgi:hypothetical protein